MFWKVCLFRCSLAWVFFQVFVKVLQVKRRKKNMFNLCVFCGTTSSLRLQRIWRPSKMNSSASKWRGISIGKHWRRRGWRFSLWEFEKRFKAVTRPCDVSASATNPSEPTSGWALFHQQLASCCSVWLTMTVATCSPCAGSGSAGLPSCADQRYPSGVQASAGEWGTSWEHKRAFVREHTSFCFCREVSHSLQEDRHSAFVGEWQQAFDLEKEAPFRAVLYSDHGEAFWKSEVYEFCRPKSFKLFGSRFWLRNCLIAADHFDLGFRRLLLMRHIPLAEKVKCKTMQNKNWTGRAPFDGCRPSPPVGWMVFGSGCARCRSTPQWLRHFTLQSMTPCWRASCNIFVDVGSAFWSVFFLHYVVHFFVCFCSLQSRCLGAKRMLVVRTKVAQRQELVAKVPQGFQDFLRCLGKNAFV